METKDAITLRGIFCLQTFENGALVDSYEDKNVIVVVGRRQLCRLLAGDVVGRSVTRIGFGEGTSPAASSDTALTSGFVKSVDSVTYPTSTSVRFNWTLGTGDANGKAITEFGLLSTDNTLFARKQRSVINKTSSISLIGTWTIEL